MKKIKIQIILSVLLLIAIPACERHKEHAHVEYHKILVTSPLAKDVVSTQQYVCQIHSHRHIEVRAMESGYLEEIPVREGQLVKKGDTMFQVVPTLYQAKLDAEVAEAQLVEIELNNTEKLFQQKVVSQPEVALAKAKLAKAQAKVQLARAELNFANVKAPFDGIVDHQRHQHGSLIAEGDILTTLSDNDIMWVYFNQPEARYLEYIADKNRGDLKIELMLAKANKEAARGTELAVQRFQAEVCKNQSEKLILVQEIVEAENRINFLHGRFPQPVDRMSGDFVNLTNPTLNIGVPWEAA